MHFQWVVVFHHLVPDPLYYMVKWKETSIFLFEDPVVAKSWWKTIISWHLMIGFIKQNFVKKRGANQNFSHKEGGWSKRGAWTISYFQGGQKAGVIFLRGGGFIPWCPLWTCVLIYSLTKCVPKDGFENFVKLGEIYPWQSLLLRKLQYLE